MDIGHVHTYIKLAPYDTKCDGARHGHAGLDMRNQTYLLMLLLIEPLKDSTEVSVGSLASQKVASVLLDDDLEACSGC